MDSKVMKIALLIVTLFVLTVFGLMLILNGYGTTRQQNIEPQTETVTECDVDESGMIIGSDIYAWMSDETFFDEDGVIAKYADAMLESSAVVLSAGSVEKDIRVKIADENGEPVKGTVFEIKLSNDKTYRDSDRDGFITISNLDPAEYELVLCNAGTYMAPDKPIKCTVKAKVEYKAIADISYLIKTEADIDVEKDDTAVNDAESETTGNSAIKTAQGATFGIDVSKYNGDIDWAKVKGDGVGFAIVRAGYRGSSSGSIVVDPYFAANMQKANEAGVPVGVYFFTQAVNTVEAVEEASAVLTLIKDYDITYPVFIDTEGAGGAGRADAVEVADRSAICQAFCETIRSGGYTAGIYASKNWFNNRLDITKLSGDNVTWLAEYADAPSYGGTYQMWQYSSAGRINGIEGRVDMNLSYLDIDNDSNGNKAEKAEKADIDDNEDDSKQETVTDDSMKNKQNKEVQ
ncbi:MAG: glycoside hydrolase family 25 protein [Lachnospiraceae bacterium]|nr:glycoside hydrolase family 25 protein [Candidatus Colinaster equi]